MEDLLHNTTAWVALSFFIFVALAVKMVGKKVVATVDARIAAIKSDIETAEKLKADTEKLLADFQAKQRDAEAEAQRIIQDAKASALNIQKAAEADLSEAMARREAQLTDRLKRLEEKTIADIQNHAAELALQATREIVAKTMDEKAGGRLIDQAIASVAKHLN